MENYDIRTVREAISRLTYMKERFERACAAVGPASVQGSKGYRTGRLESFDYAMEMLNELQGDSS